MIGSEGLRALLEEHRRAHDVVGAQVGVLLDGEVMLASAGLADLDAGTPMTDEVTIPVASVTKPMVATVVWRLAQQGLLSLDDSVAARVPELASSDWARAATVRQLLASTSGVPMREAREFVFDGNDPDAFARYAEAVAPDPPMTTPGDVWGYANTGWCILGRVIEIARGGSWEDAMRGELFEPLGMTATRFWLDGDVEQPSACYNLDDGEPTRIKPPAMRAIGPAGLGLWSSVRDLLRFAGPHVETDEYAALREVQASPPLPEAFDDWCLGMARFRYAGGDVWGWDGIGHGNRAILRFVPGRGAIALLANTSSGRDMYRTLFPILFEQLYAITMPPVPARETAPETPLERFTGTYGWLDTTLEITAEDGALVIREGEQRRTLHRVREATFALDPAAPADTNVTFADPDEHGRPRLLYYQLWAFPRRD